MGEYTVMMENALFSEPDVIDDYEAATKAFLDCDELCRTFGQGLVTFMETYCGYSAGMDPVAFLKECCKERGVPSNDIAKDNRTFKGWFFDSQRLKERKPMFAIAFALGLNTAQTKALFNKVLLDRAFEFRNADEIIYYYCIKHNKTWAEAKRLIESVAAADQESSDYTVATEFIRSDADALEDDAQLIDYVSKHGHNLSLKSVTANKTFAKYTEEARKFAKKEADALDRDGDNLSIWDKFKGADRDSNSFLYYVITDQSLVGENGTNSILKRADERLQSNAFSCFPTDKTFANKSLTNEKLRKAIVLVHFYYFWMSVKEKCKGKPIPYDMFDEYRLEADSVLAECGFSTLYPGNPFDWLFLYCSLEEEPVNTLRSVIGDMLETDEE